MDMRKSDIISFDSLLIGYGSGRHKRALLPPLSAAAETGEFIAVIGRNGVGKSTLLRTITGLQTPLGGTILINGSSIESISSKIIAQAAGYISTEVVRVSNMSVFDLVALGRFPHTNWIGSIDRASRDAINEALEKTGMKGFSTRYVSELSDGERQRAMIARLLAQDTPLMVMDEPTAFLDIPGKYDVVNLLHNLTRDGRTIIFSTHDLNIAVNMSDKIWLILKDGLISGSPEELIKNGSFSSLFESSLFGFDPESGNLAMKDGKHDHLKYFL